MDTNLCEHDALRKKSRLNMDSGGVDVLQLYSRLFFQYFFECLTRRKPFGLNCLFSICYV